MTSALRDLAYAGAVFVWSVAAFTILGTGVSVVTASLLAFVVGVFVWLGFVYVVRWTTWVDRRLAGWQLHQRLDAADPVPRERRAQQGIRTSLTRITVVRAAIA